jgi:uncharacterized RDD family membrane protein YckC
VTAEQLDTIVAAETPEGFVLELRPAGLTVRVYAFLLDWVIRIAVLYSLAMVAAFMDGIGFAFWLILLFAAEWLYPVAFELTPSGATPGKRVFNLRVVMENGLPVTPAAALTRNLLRAADFLPFAYGFAIVSVLLRPDNKRLGDLAAGTLVVTNARAAVGGASPEVPVVAPAMTLTARQQAALIGLAARGPRLTAERLDELAALAARVTGDETHPDPETTRRVLGVAQWALGRRA